MPVMPTDLPQGTTATAVSTTNWNALIDGINNLKDYLAGGGHVYNVMHPDFGTCYNDGTHATETTAAFTAAILAAYTAGGGTVYVPHGAYLINSITLTNAVSLEGIGTITLNSTATITCTNSATLRVRIRDVAITGASGTGLTLTSAINVDIHNVKFYTLAAGIIGSDCSNISVAECEFKDITGNGIYFHSNCHDFSIVSNKFDTCASGNTNKGIGFCGFYGAVSVPCYNIQIIGNILSHTGHLAIELWGGVTNSIVSDNVIAGIGRDSGWGISLDTTDSCTVANNNIKAVTHTIAYGIELAGADGNIILGNIIDGANIAIAITAADSHDNLIDTNIVFNSISEGIRTAGYNNLVMHNKILNASGKIIHNFGGAGIEVFSNVGRTSSVTAGYCLSNDNGTLYFRDNDLSGKNLIAAQSYNSRADVFTANAADDTATLTNSYEFADGDIVTLTTTGTLPAPLLASTNYYVILTAVSKTYKLAANKQNAMIGSQIDITDAGSGTHTLTRYATFFVGQGNKFNGGKGTLQNVTGGVTLHEYTGYIGTDKNQDLIGFGDIIPYWTQGHTQKRMIGGGTGTKLTFKFKQLSGGQPRITFYVVWNGRNDNNPRGGFFTLAFGTYDDFDVNPISDQMGTVITIAAVAYDGSGYPYWDVTFPVNASLWYMVQASGESADSSVLEISQS